MIFFYFTRTKINEICLIHHFLGECEEQSFLFMNEVGKYQIDVLYTFCL